LILAAVLLACLWFPVTTKNTEASLGLDWECTPQAQGGPTCIKKIRP